VRLTAWAERHVTLLLAAMIALYIVALFAGLTYKLATWAQGYDQIDYQQAIWNTTQGRFLEISHYRHTDSLWGMDFIPAILLVVPLYALAPSALTLNLLQALCMGLGALPAYGLARDRFGGARPAGLVAAAVYLLYPSVWFVTMSAPWQPRTLAVPALLGAVYFLQRASMQPGRNRPQARRDYLGYLGCLLLALSTRTDTSLVVIACGLLALAWRAGWRWILPPIVAGAAWFWVSTAIVVPSFYRADYHPQEIVSTGDACLDYSKNWPGKSPQLAYYCHLGGSAGEIVGTIVTRPVFVAQIVFTAEKMRYLALMLLPLALLPLLAPDALLLAAPPLLMNLLSLRPFQITVREQYQTLVIPGLIVAAIVGAARLWLWLRARRDAPRPDGPAPGYLRRAMLAAAGLLVLTLLCNLAYRNPVLSAVRYRESDARLAAMRHLAAMVPADAPLAATSFLAPPMMPRREIFYFPRDESFPPLERAEYLFVDRRAAALDRTDLLEQVLRSPEWRVLADEQDLLLLRRER
jgi:hypothetical protein